MSVTLGTRLGVYEVTGKIGEGGMGEVYQARDTTLDRDVALKVLPEAFTADPDRLARFQREAKVLASLNHQNIGAIHGFERSDDSQALVLELIEGPTLADRIAAGAIPVDEVLAIAEQITEALEAAHEQGIVHRDLKPANVKVRPDGTVKVLDFGLAKAVTSDAGVTGAAESVTMSITGATQMGMVIGTAAYMAPEQARGQPVDKRADVWAFGVLLYEMLAGQRLFSGGDVSQTLAQVLMQDVDWATLPTETPSSITQLLRRCLERDPKQRLRDIGEARIAVSGAGTALPTHEPATNSPARRRVWQRLIPAGVTALMLVVVSVLAIWNLTGPESMRVARFGLASPEQPVNLSATQIDVAIAPDGTQVVYMAGSSNSTSALAVRTLDQLTGIPLEATVAPQAFSPFISPDSSWVGFFNLSAFTIEKVAISVGPSITVCELGAARLYGASWGSDDFITFGTGVPTGLWRVSAGGGVPEEITTTDGSTNHVWPNVLPGGRAVLFTDLTGGLETAQVAVVNLETREQKILIPEGHSPRYASTGHLVYAARGALRAVPFDLQRLEVTGNPVPLVDDLAVKQSGAANFGISEDGGLVYTTGAETGGEQRALVWVDRQGREEYVPAEPRAYLYPRISPDGARVALDIRDEDNDIWVFDVLREALTRLTFDPAGDTYPVWAPDGGRVLFSSAREETIQVFSKASDGTGSVERLTDHPGGATPFAVSPDGQQLVMGVPSEPAVSDLVRVPLGTSGDVESLLESAAIERNATLSPDGEWLAYQSNESGRYEVYVRPFPDTGAGRWQVSRAGGIQPAWNPNGQELFYSDLTPSLIAVAVRADGATFSLANPEALFETRGYFAVNNSAIGRAYDVSPDGERFLLIKQDPTDENAALPRVILVQNWFEELNARVPVP